jgi:hypothetical protein
LPRRETTASTRKGESFGARLVYRGCGSIPYFIPQFLIHCYFLLCFSDAGCFEYRRGGFDDIP